MNEIVTKRNFAFRQCTSVAKLPWDGMLASTYSLTSVFTLEFFRLFFFFSEYDKTCDDNNGVRAHKAEYDTVPVMFKQVTYMQFSIFFTFAVFFHWKWQQFEVSCYCHSAIMWPTYCCYHTQMAGFPCEHSAAFTLSFLV